MLQAPSIQKLLLLPILLGSCWAQSNPLNLARALETADLNNLELRAARQQRAISLAGLSIARQILNPTISFGATRDTPHESIVWDQPIELGGKRSKRIAVAQEERKATEIDIAILAKQIRRRTREAFFRLLSAQALTEQSKAALDLATRLKEIVQQRFELGDVAQLEVIQADVELARQTAEYQAAIEGQKSVAAQLAALLNRPLLGPLELDGRIDAYPRPVSLQILTDAALKTNAELQKTNQELQIEQRRLALARSQRIPNLGLQAGTDFNSPPDFNVGARGQIAVTLPLFNRGQGEVAQSTARLDLLRLSLQAQQVNASAQVTSAYFDYVAKSGQAEQYATKIVPQTIRLQQMAEDSYRSGKSNLLVVIDAQRRLNETRKAYIDGLMAVHSSIAILEEVVGTPID